MLLDCEGICNIRMVRSKPSIQVFGELLFEKWLYINKGGRLAIVDEPRKRMKRYLESGCSLMLFLIYWPVVFMTR